MQGKSYSQKNKQLVTFKNYKRGFPYGNAAFGEVYLTNDSTQKVFEMREREFITWKTTQKFASTNYNIGSHDVAPGCKFSLTGSQSIRGYNNVSHWLLNLFSNTQQLINYFTFMPTKSTLDFKGSSILLKEPINNRNLVQTHETPFDAYYCPPNHEEHVELNTANVAWLLNELNTVSNTNIPLNVICNPRITSLSIDGSQNLCDVMQKTYTLTPNNLTNITWNVTNLQIMYSNNQEIRVRKIHPYLASHITATYNGGAGIGSIQASKMLICNRPNMRFAVDYKNNLNPTFNLKDMPNEVPISEQDIASINWEITSGDGQILWNNCIETEVIGTNFTGVVTVYNEAGESYSRNFFYPDPNNCKTIQKAGYDTYQVIDRCNNNAVIANITEKEVYNVYGYKIENLPLNNSNIELNNGNTGDIQILRVVSEGENLIKRIIKD